MSSSNTCPNVGGSIFSKCGLFMVKASANSVARCIRSWPSTRQYPISARPVNCTAAQERPLCIYGRSNLTVDFRVIGGTLGQDANQCSGPYEAAAVGARSSSSATRSNSDPVPKESALGQDQVLESTHGFIHSPAGRLSY